MFQDILTVRDHYVKEGLLIEEATMIAEKYILRTQELSKGPYKFYELIDSESASSQDCITRFHNCDTLRNVNFYTPTLSEFRENVLHRHEFAGSLFGYLQSGGNMGMYNKLAKLSTKSKVAQQPIRAKHRAMFNFSTRNFCTKPQPEEAKESGFTAYLKKLVQVEKKKEEEGKNVEKLENILNKDPSEVKIGFHKIKSAITLENSGEPVDVNAASVATEAEIQEQIKTELDLLIEKANKKYGLNFYKEFALSDEKMTRISLEEYVNNIPDHENIPLFVASFLSNAYQLNSWIPNAHMLFYNMFCSPKINLEQRKELEKTDLLAGNLFPHQISIIGYQSLLRSVLLTGKKKHFKKIVQHIQKYLLPNDPNAVATLINPIIQICNAHDFPILMGQIMKVFLENNVQISKEDFVTFYSSMDRVKGLEKDTVRFITAINDTKHIQLDWDLVKPWFMRALNFKNALEILQKFEQVRSKMVPNASHSHLSKEEYEKLANQMQIDFHTKFIHELLSKKAIEIAYKVYFSYKKEAKFDFGNDITALNIACAEKSIEKFEGFLKEMLEHEKVVLEKFQMDQMSQKAKAKKGEKAQESTTSAGPIEGVMTKETAEKIEELLKKMRNDDNNKAINKVSNLILHKIKL